MKKAILPMLLIALIPTIFLISCQSSDNNYSTTASGFELAAVLDYGFPTLTDYSFYFCVDECIRETHESSPYENFQEEAVQVQCEITELMMSDWHDYFISSSIYILNEAENIVEVVLWEEFYDEERTVEKRILEHLSYPEVVIFKYSAYGFEH